MKAMDDKISYTVLINESSGTVLREGQTHIEDVIRGEGGSCIKDVHFLPMKILLEEAL